MPIYEYYCNGCNRKVSVFFRSISEARETEAVCPQCESTDLERRVSRFRKLRGKSGGGSGADDLPFDESDLSALENEDPRAMAGLFRKMSEETGEGFDPELEEVVTRLERGEAPDKIEKDLDDREGQSVSDDAE